jgi:glycosyltransferase involved in cell wall biosynthesis
MQVFLDLTPLVTISSLRGIGRYVRGLVQGFGALDASERQGIELIGLAADNELTALHRVTDLAEQCARPARPPVRGAGKRRTRLLSFAAPRLVGDSGGLLHLAEPKGYPLPRSLPVTATAHDLISLALPELYLPKVPLWAHMLRASLRIRYARYRGVIAVSQATRRDLCHMLKLAPERVHVVEHGVDHARFHPRPEALDASHVAEILGDAEQPFVLYLGAGDARKDLDTLVRAFALSRTKSHAKLVLAGRHDAWRVKALGKLIRELGVEDRVIRCGYVDETVVPALYRRARVHAFVSRYEGFGLPVLEALACGTPTITSPGSSLDEVSADAALIVPCGQVEPLRDAIDQLFFDDSLRARMRELGLARAQTFTWQACARKTLTFFNTMNGAA